MTINNGNAIKFTVYGLPKPKARARTVKLRNGKTVSYTPKKTEDWEDSIRLQALEHRQEPLWDEALIFEATFILPKPKSVPKKRIFPETKPDLDNLCKSVTDALEGLIYTNDSRIVDKVLRKRYGDAPGVEVRISKAEAVYRPIVSGGHGLRR